MGEADFRIFTASHDMTVRLWDPFDMGCVQTLAEGRSEIASMTYFVEKEASHWTFIDSFWYSLMTLTTVGNESQPNSMSGKVSSIIYTYLQSI